jgi:hypothetical protein
MGNASARTRQNTPMSVVEQAYITTLRSKSKDDSPIGESAALAAQVNGVAGTVAPESARPRGRG